MRKNHIETYDEQGFTLIELLIVVAIIGILAAIAYPSYQGYIERGHRADMMSEMHNIASTIESRKIAKGKYSSVATTDLVDDYPSTGTALYTVTLIPNPLTSQWTISAIPKSNSRMKGDGTLTLNNQGVKCRANACGTGDEWR